MVDPSAPRINVGYGPRRASPLGAELFTKLPDLMTDPIRQGYIRPFMNSRKKTVNVRARYCPLMQPSYIDSIGLLNQQAHSHYFQSFCTIVVSRF